MNCRRRESIFPVSPIDNKPRWSGPRKREMQTGLLLATMRISYTAGPLCPDFWTSGCYSLQGIILLSEASPNRGRPGEAALIHPHRRLRRNPAPGLDAGDAVPRIF